jgi:hypothetical protein
VRAAHLYQAASGSPRGGPHLDTAVEGSVGRYRAAGRGGRGRTCVTSPATSRANTIARIPEVSTSKATQYFIADNEREKEDWINAVGRAIVQRSVSMQEDEVLSY